MVLMYQSIVLKTVFQGSAQDAISPGVLRMLCGCGVRHKFCPACPSRLILLMAGLCGNHVRGIGCLKRCVWE